MSDAKYWIWLAQLKKLNCTAAGRYLHHFGSVKKLYYAGREEYVRVPGASEAEINSLLDKNLDAADKIEASCHELGIRTVSLYDAEYPDRLRNIYDAPLLLYVKGRLPTVDDLPCIAVVGTRRASPYGLKCASGFAAEITRGGGIVVTGIAEGIDSAASKAALKAGGPTIAVLGTGIDVVFPAWNGELQEAVAKNGALISEYPPGRRGSKISFPARNRIISGLSLGVVIIEAPKKSGALITASHASEQGRDVYVVPGNIDNPGFAGSNELIRDGAALVINGWEVLSCYKWRYPEKIQKAEAKKPGILETVRRLAGTKNAKTPAMCDKKEVDKVIAKEYIDLKEREKLSESEIKVLTALACRKMQKDEIIRETGMDASDVLTALTMLELGGYVRTDDSQSYEADI